MPESAAAVLHASRRAGLPPSVIPQLDDLDQALAVQLEVAELFRAEGDPVGAWKVGMTSGSMQDRYGPGVRPFGFVQSSRILRSGDTVRYADPERRELEPEICLVLGEPLRGAVDPARARLAVRAVAPAFELVQLRLDAGDPTNRLPLVADGLGQWGIVVGAEVEPPATFDRLRVKLYADERLVAEASVSETIALDDPYLSLSRLAARLDEYGIGLEVGTRVITGSLTRSELAGGSTWRASFEGIGEVSLDAVLTDR